MKIDENFLKKQKEALLAEKSVIEKKIEKLKKYPDYGGDEEDNIQESSDYESNLSIETQLSFLLNKIDKALKSIEKGTYGVCSKCKKNIEHGRLEVMPYADLCVTCQEDKK